MSNEEKMAAYVNIRSFATKKRLCPKKRDTSVLPSQREKDNQYYNDR